MAYANNNNRVVFCQEILKALGSDLLEYQGLAPALRDEGAEPTTAASAGWTTFELFV
jgi:hypothetical protein